MRVPRFLMLVSATALVAACEGDTVTEPSVQAPRNVAVAYEWILEGWAPFDLPVEPVGDPAVAVRWDLPEAWNGDPFRVYAGRAGGGGDFLVATVTSCAAGGCLYTDINVAHGESYDYYVTTVDERSGRESVASNVEGVTVPVFDPPPPPADPHVTEMNNALLLGWEDGGAGNDLWKYLVFLFFEEDGELQFYQVGETDGEGFLDLRAQNGVEYTYRIAAVDLDGHISRMSGPATGTPRAGANAALMDDPAVGSSPGRIGVGDADSPVIPMNDAGSSWRLEVVNGRYVLRDR